jgi:hypothetical protein
MAPCISRARTIKLPTLASTLKKMVEAERKAGKRNRAKGVAAARDRFYKATSPRRWWRS